MDVGELLQDAVVAAIGVNGAVFALAGIGLNLHFGYTGLLNFGHAAFMMLGAYGLAITVNEGGPFWLGLIMAVLAPAALGLLLGVPTLRLRADYLAITTIAAQEILRLLFRSSLLAPVTRGVFGIQRFADPFYRINPFPPGSYGVADIGFDARSMWLITVGWTLVALSAALVFLLIRSPWGRVLKSIREDEDAARSLGKNVFGYKLQSLVIGGVIGGLAGVVLATNFQSANPDAFLPVLTFFVYAVIILGGPASILGPVAGAIIFWFVIDFTRGFMEQLVATGFVSPEVLTGQDIFALRFVLVGLLLLLFMAFRPQGVFGNREEMMLDAG